MATRTIFNLFRISLKGSTLSILLFINNQSTTSQQSNSLFFMHTLPQSNLTNPAVQIPCKVFVGVPALSSIYLNYSNSYFSYNDVLQPTSNDSLLLNLHHFDNISSSLQDIAMEFHISLLNFGFLYNDYYFNFNLSDKVEAGIVYPGNWFNFLLHGNTPHVGENIDLVVPVFMLPTIENGPLALQKSLTKN